MKHNKIIIIIFSIIFFSCKSKTKKPETEIEQRFPLIELLQNDADDVIKVPYDMDIKTYSMATNKLLDSSKLSREKFAAIVKPILAANIDEEKAKENYTETSFHDLSMRTISVVVNATKPNVELRSITAHFDDEKNKLQNALITFETNEKDTAITQKIFWKINKSITIATSKSINNKTVEETKQLINWNDKN